MGKIIVLIGAPGAGKGTQARLLEERKHIRQISTGDMFREMMKLDSPLAREVQTTMALGNLVSDELTFQIVKNRISRDDCQGTYILDGFPRTAVQAVLLETLAAEQGNEISAILIDVPLEDLTYRMTGRRICPICGEIYNVFYKKPKNDNFCDFHTNTQLNHRADDMEEKVQIRLSTYQEQTKPLIEYYENSNRLEKVNGTAEPETIYQELEKLVQ